MQNTLLFSMVRYDCLLALTPSQLLPMLRILTHTKVCFKSYVFIDLNNYFREFPKQNKKSQDVTQRVSLQVTAL
jgi:hypothetical protein